MGFCKPMSEEVPLINTKTISKEELDAQRENAAKVQAVLQSRYTDKPLACVITYGCQQNVADSEHIKGMLADMGYAFTDDRHKAQFILFNTCAVREHAEDRVFGNVGALKSYKAEHPDTVIALCGCMMQQQHIAERIKQSFPFVDLVFGTHVVHRLPELLLRTLTRKKRVFELPDMDGVEVIRRIRSWSNMPIIVISARSEDVDKIEALDAGADDYLTKPFSVEELLARLRVTQRRLAAAQSEALSADSVFINGRLRIDFAAGCAYIDGGELHLTPIEYKLLCLLAKNVGKVLTHPFITQKIWGSSWDNDIASLRVFMATLRKKLEAAPDSPQYIQTHIGVGYRMLRVE